MTINTGDPIILRDAKGLKKFGLTKDMKGYANVVVHVDDQDLVMFKPEGIEQFYYIELERVELDEEKMAQLEEDRGVLKLEEKGS